VTPTPSSEDELGHTAGLVKFFIDHEELFAQAQCGTDAPAPDVSRAVSADNLEIKQIISALKHDKKSVDGQINWVLLEGVGRPKIVEGKLISAKSLRLSLRAGLQPARGGRKVHRNAKIK